jgi:arylsulfatase A-like enzyme
VLVNVVDLFPTIAQVAGVHVDDLPNAVDPALPLQIDGVSLLPVLHDPKAKVRTTNFAEKFSPGGGGPFDSATRTARDDQYKLILDVNCDVEMFYEYLPGQWDEGPDLLELGPLTAEQEAGRAALRAAIDAEWAALPYESDTWQVRDDVVGGCHAADTGDTGAVGAQAPVDTDD